MTLVAGIFRRRVSLALLRESVNKDRAGRAHLDRSQNRQELVHVVPVNRTDIQETEFLEERSAHHAVLENVLGPLRAFAERLRAGDFDASAEAYAILARGVAARLAECNPGYETG